MLLCAEKYTFFPNSTKRSAQADDAWKKYPFPWMSAQGWQHILLWGLPPPLSPMVMVIHPQNQLYHEVHGRRTCPPDTLSETNKLDDRPILFHSGLCIEENGMNSHQKMHGYTNLLWKSVPWPPYFSGHTPDQLHAWNHPWWWKPLFFTCIMICNRWQKQLWQ